MRKPRHLGQKISYALAIASALMMLPSAGLLAWFWQTRGFDDVWVPSLFSIIAFFGCCAVVLYAMSIARPKLPPADPAVDH